MNRRRRSDLAAKATRVVVAFAIAYFGLHVALATKDLGLGALVALATGCIVGAVDYVLTR